MPELLLARHGETEWSLNGRHTGTTDLPLTENGRRRARNLAPRLVGRTFALVLTSPLQRAIDTCELAGLGRRAEVRAEIVEWNYGDYEGRTTPEIREERPGWFLWRDGCPGGEDAAAVGARVGPIVEELRAADGDVALFAHGHVLRVVAARWLELPPAEGARLALATGTLSALGWEREMAAVRLWNSPPPSR